MAEKKTCLDCGAALPHDAPEGFCPQCLLAAGETQAQTRADHEGATRDGADQPLGITQHAVTRFGDYELLEEIARGGMGVVYKARQRSLNRIVAVKLILAGQFAGKQHVQRFRGEATAAAVLQHPNIVAVHEVGTHEGQHFFSMDYVEGQNLTQLVGNRPLPPQKATRYVKLIAEAIHYAHEQGILHRDLKPSNVLIDSATDQPRVTDFGLAKRIDSDSSLTVTGQVLGTPNFMPPEQARGTRGKVGRQSDVYGLGGILYYTLTARAPFQGDTLETTIHEVLNTEPLSPRALNPSVPRDLETICLKCLEKEPSRRYPTAQELAGELVRFLNDEPIHARPVSHAERVWRWCRRKPVVASLSAATLLLVLAVAIGSPVAAYRISNERNQKELESYAADMALVQADLRENNFGRATELVRKYLPVAARNPKLLGWEWRYLWQLCRGEEKRTLTTNGTSCVVFSPDGKTLVTASADGTDPTAMVWDADSMSPVATLAGFDGFIDSRATVFSPDGKFLAIKGGSRVKIWETHDWQKPFDDFEGEPNRAKNWNNAVVFSPDSKSVVLRVKEGVAIRNFEPKISEPIPIKGTQNLGTVLEYSPDGALLAVSDWLKLHLLDTRNFREVTNVMCQEGGANRVLSAAFHGNLLAVGDRIGRVQLYRTNDWAQLGEIDAHPGITFDLAFSPDGSALATGGIDQVIKFWDVASLTNHAPRRPEPFATLRGHHRQLVALSFSPDGQLLASAAPDGVKLWQFPRRREQAMLADSLQPIGFTSDSKKLITLARDERIQVWNTASRQLMAQVGPLGEDWPNDQHPRHAVSPDGKLLAKAVINGVVEIWNLETTRLENSFKTGKKHDKFSRMAFSPFQRWLAATYYNSEGTHSDFGVHLYNLATAQLERVFRSDYETFAFCPDERLFATLATDGANIQVVDLVNGKVRHRLSMPMRGVPPLAFSSDAKLLAAGMGDGSVVIWDVASGQRKHLTIGDGQTAMCVAFSPDPDAKTLATCTWDNVVKLWHIPTGREILRFANFNPGGFQVMFSPDGNSFALPSKLVSGQPAGGVELLRAPTFAEIAAAEKTKEQSK